MSGYDLHMLFNPQQSTLRQLEATLTAKRRTVALPIVEQLAEAVRTGSSFNNLLVGPRGSGKTHLVAYVRKTLEHRFPENGAPIFVKLSEEERGITSLYDLVVACLRAIGVDQQTLSAGMPQKREDRLTYVRDLFDEKIDGQPAIVFIENLADVFASLDEDELNTLRHFLQDRPRLSVLGSSVTLFQNSSAPDHPFYGYFTPRHLNELTAEEAQEYLAQLAVQRGDDALAGRIRSRETLPRVRAIHALTGGNHRLLGLLSEFLTVEDLDKLVPAFLRMADRELTAYYQQRLDRLNNQQVKIVRALADERGRGLPVRDIAEYTSLTQQATSRLLTDLRSADWVISKKEGRESYYDLREPLVRLVFELKAGYETLPSIVNILRTWYTVDELKTRMGDCGEFSTRYLSAALEWHAEIETGAGRERMAFRSEGVSAARSGEVWKAIEEFRHEDALTLLEEWIRDLDDLPDLESESKLAGALFFKGATLHLLDRFSEALAAYDEVVSRFGEREETPLSEQVARALVNKGVTLHELDRSSEALAACDEVVSRFGEREETPLSEQVARALVNEGVALHALDRSSEALATWDEVVSRFGEREETRLLENVARALLNKGAALHHLDRPSDALSAYDEVVSRFGDREEVSLSVPVARALFYKAVALGALDRSPEELAAYDEVVSRFGDREEVSLSEPVARALINKGVELGALDRSSEAIAAYDEVVSRFGDREESSLLEPVARATFKSGLVFAKDGEPDRGIRLIHEAIASGSKLDTEENIIRDAGNDILNAFIDYPESVALRALSPLLQSPDVVANGAIQWLKRRVPLDSADAPRIKWVEGVLQAALREIEKSTDAEGADPGDLKQALRLVAAARAYTGGERQALYDLPLELRRLLQPGEEK